MFEKISGFFKQFGRGRKRQSGETTIMESKQEPGADEFGLDDEFADTDDFGAGGSYGDTGDFGETGDDELSAGAVSAGPDAEGLEDEDFAGELLKVDPELEKAQVQRVQAVRNWRNQAYVDDKLRALVDAAKGTDNLMPHIREAVSAYATLGEVSDSLREVFGIHKPQ